jgi:hypothetical protein
MLGPNHFPESNQVLFIFLHLIINLQGHILSTGGVALTSYGTHQKMSYEVQPTKNVQKNIMKVRKCQKGNKTCNITGELLSNGMLASRSLQLLWNILTRVLLLF